LYFRAVLFAGLAAGRRVDLPNSDGSLVENRSIG
jgi:hypothetical protein